MANNALVLFPVAVTFLSYGSLGVYPKRNLDLLRGSGDVVPKSTAVTDFTVFKVSGLEWRNRLDRLCETEPTRYPPLVTASGFAATLVMGVDRLRTVGIRACSHHQRSEKDATVRPPT
ncbi:hypothetical protein DFH08DRAFT_821014 [Mycena albidolilacea]|uniref:Uncharacterized protein n=1 Tax=Mycena albidolilacea TaxID=1033008 RepID=A0AAD6ZBD2_9AGAR|nr:hypothetical protein DFH08DRAFT_821014 [Mycena albidolilacea]